MNINGARYNRDEGGVKYLYNVFLMVIFAQNPITAIPSQSYDKTGFS